MFNVQRNLNAKHNKHIRHTPLPTPNNRKSWCLILSSCSTVSGRVDTFLLLHCLSLKMKISYKLRFSATCIMLNMPPTPTEDLNSTILPNCIDNCWRLSAALIILVCHIKVPVIVLLCVVYGVLCFLSLVCAFNHVRPSLTSLITITNHNWTQEANLLLILILVTSGGT